MTEDLNALPVVVQPHAFSAAHFEAAMPRGLSIAQIVERARLPEHYRPFVRVWVNAREVPAADWAALCPREGEVVYLRVVAHGGGGGGKNPLQTVLSLALIVSGQIWGVKLGAAMGLSTAPIAVGSAASVASVVGGAIITLGGSLILSALIPPPRAPQVDNSFGTAAPPSYRITGVSNRMNPYGPIPRVMGRTRIYPVVAARPYTESAGNDQYVRLLFLAGYGPLDISDIKIGETPITAFNNVECEVLQGNPAGWSPAVPCAYATSAITLYTQTITETALSVNLPGAGAWEQRNTVANTREISLDISLPRGLFGIGDDGRTSPNSVAYAVQYRLQGSGTWIDAVWANSSDAGFGVPGVITMTAADKTALRISGRITGLAAGVYEVQVKRTSPVPPPNGIQDSAWTALRSILYTPPVNQAGVCLIALRIKANEQLNGVPDNINCIAQAYHPVYAANVWTWTLTRSPAWEYVDILRRRGAEYLVADSRIDLAAMQDWASACAATAPNAAEPYWQYDAVIEGGSVFAALHDIASHARAAPAMRDGLYSITRDVLQTVPVQHITPANSWGYSGSKSFVDLPHGLKIGFTNAAAGYVQDEVMVYADGYSSANATLFETFSFPGCQSATQAWREGRYHLAVGSLRPEEHRVTMDIENLRCTQGSLVRFAHDVISVGLGSGRIKAVTVSAGNVTAVQFEGTVDMVAATNYAFRARQPDGSSVLCPVAAVGTDTTTDTVTLVTPLAVASAPAAGDLYMFGVANSESAPMLVRRIEAAADLTATLTLVDAQSGVWTADSGTIPAFNTYITVQGPLRDQAPAAPGYALRSDDTALLILADGTVMDRIVVAIGAPSYSPVTIDSYEVQYKESAGTTWQSAGRYGADAREAVINGVRKGVNYDVRVRSISIDGRASDWVSTSAHSVAGKALPPVVPTALTATPGLYQITLDWTAPAATSPDIKFTEVWGATANNRASAALVTTAAWPALSATHLGIAPANAWYYWIRFIDSTGNPGDWFPAGSTAGVSATPDGLSSIITSTDISDALAAAGMQPVSIVTSLPSPIAYAGPKVLMLTTDGKLYRYDAGAFTADVAAADISGTVSAAVTAGTLAGQGALATQNTVTWSSQITGSGKPADNADVTAAHTAAGIAGQGAFATMSQITSGAQVAYNILIGSHLVSGTVTAGQMATGTITAAAGIIANAAVDTLQVAGHAITVPVTAYTGTVTTPGSGGPFTLQSVTITTTGEVVDLDWALGTSVVNTSGGTYLYLYRDSTNLVQYSNNCSGTSELRTVSARYSEQPAAGTYTYYLKASLLSHDFTEIFMKAGESKR